EGRHRYSDHCVRRDLRRTRCHALTEQDARGEPNMETGPATRTTEQPAVGELAHNSIGLGRVIGFPAGFIGPGASIRLGLVVTFSITGFATPFVVLVALIGALLTGASIAEFARRTPSAGGLYTYNARGLGHPGGFITGWLLFFAYMVYVP